MTLEQLTHKALAKRQFGVAGDTGSERLADFVREALDNYFVHLNGHAPTDLYEMVLAEVEKPLLSCVMRHMGGNQTRAAQVLGISRSTLRKKLARYQID